MTESQPRIRALLDIERSDLIHNDLISSAFHLNERIKVAVNGGDRNGVALDMMAALAMTAFAYEAYINFVGFTALPGWNEKAERKSIWSKERKIFEHLGLKYDEADRPRSTVLALREAREVMAHGKPEIHKKEWEAVGTHSQLENELRSYMPDWQKRIDPDFVQMAFDDVERVWQDMLKAANIRVFETLDVGSSGITFLGYEDQVAQD